MKKVNLFVLIVALAVFLIISFFSIPASTLFSPSLKNFKPIEIGVLAAEIDMPAFGSLHTAN